MILEVSYGKSTHCSVCGGVRKDADLENEERGLYDRYPWRPELKGFYGRTLEDQVALSDGLRLVEEEHHRRHAQFVAIIPGDMDGNTLICWKCIQEMNRQGEASRLEEEKEAARVRAK